MDPIKKQRIVTALIRVLREQAQMKKQATEFVNSMFMKAFTEEPKPKPKLVSPEKKKKIASALKATLLV